MDSSMIPDDEFLNSTTYDTNDDSVCSVNNNNPVNPVGFSEISETEFDDSDEKINMFLRLLIF